MAVVALFCLIVGSRAGFVIAAIGSAGYSTAILAAEGRTFRSAEADTTM
jgi:hypothetical protein